MAMHFQSDRAFVASTAAKSGNLTANVALLVTTLQPALAFSKISASLIDSFVFVSFVACLARATDGAPLIRWGSDSQPAQTGSLTGGLRKA